MRSRRGMIKVCFQYNINFPFIKSITHRPPVLTALCRASQAPWGEGPCELRSPGLSTWPPWQEDNKLDSYPLFPSQSVCCSYSLQHRNVLLRGRSKQQACSRGCVCVSKREEIPLPRPVCIYNINTPLHMSTSDNLLITVYICPHKHFNHWCNTCHLYIVIFMIEKGNMHMLRVINRL